MSQDNNEQSNAQQPNEQPPAQPEQPPSADPPKPMGPEAERIVETTVDVGEKAAQSLPAQAPAEQTVVESTVRVEKAPSSSILSTNADPAHISADALKGRQKP